MKPLDLNRIVAWCAEQDIHAETQGAAVWLPNPGAPGHGVRVEEHDGLLVWTLALAKVPAAERVPDVLRALALLDAAPQLGAWILGADRRVAYRVALPTTGAALDDDGLFDVLRRVWEAGNAHVHALVEVIDGREPPDYVERA